MGINPTKCVTIAIGLLCLCCVADSVPNTSIINVLCNNGVYTSGELEEETPAQRNYDYHNISPYPNAYAYGHATCNLNLTSSDCKTCLGAAQTAFFSTCQTPRIGARSVLYDCAIRYEQYPFDDQKLNIELWCSTFHHKALYVKSVCVWIIQNHVEKLVIKVTLRNKIACLILFFRIFYSCHVIYATPNEIRFCYCC